MNQFSRNLRSMGGGGMEWPLVHFGFDADIALLDCDFIVDRRCDAIDFQ